MAKVQLFNHILTVRWIKKPTINSIINIVLDFYNTDIHKIGKRKTRDAKIVLIRHTIIFFCRKYTDDTYNMIAKKLSLISHATAINGRRKSEELLITNSEYKKEMERINISISRAHNIEIKGLY